MNSDQREAEGWKIWRDSDCGDLVARLERLKITVTAETMSGLLESMDEALQMLKEEDES